jgi:hypothetical protein
VAKVFNQEYNLTEVKSSVPIKPTKKKTYRGKF